MKSYEMLNITLYDIIKTNFTEIWALKDWNLMCTGPIKTEMFHNTHFLPHFHVKSVCHDCVWYGEYLGRIYQKFKFVTLAHIFAYNSKSILPQSASFIHAGTQMIPSRWCVHKWWQCPLKTSEEENKVDRKMTSVSVCVHFVFRNLYLMYFKITIQSSVLNVKYRL